MFFNQCPCKFKYYDECDEYRDSNLTQKNKCNCRFPSNENCQKPQKGCDCDYNNSQHYPQKSRSECKFCIEGTIKFKDDCNLW